MTTRRKRVEPSRIHREKFLQDALEREQSLHHESVRMVEQLRRENKQIGDTFAALMKELEELKAAQASADFDRKALKEMVAVGDLMQHQRDTLIGVLEHLSTMLYRRKRSGL